MSNFDSANGPQDPLRQLPFEQGGLPHLALRRIQSELADPKRHFTSDLSVNELLLTRENGFIPVSQVMGSSVYHVGWQYTPFYSSTELSVISHAFWHARTLALTRMQQEAHMLGAHGVVGVRLEKRAYDWGRDLIEFIAVGTAIRMPGKALPSHPFLSDLSGQEFWALRQAGFFPVGLCYGNCVWYQVASWQTMTAQNQTGGGFFNTTSYANQELVDYTQAVYQARHSAMSRLHDECQVFGASGAVGVHVETKIEEREVDYRDYSGRDGKRTDLIVRFEAIGTAVVEVEPNLAPVVDYALLLK